MTLMESVNEAAGHKSEEMPLRKLGQDLSLQQEQDPLSPAVWAYDLAR